MKPRLPGRLQVFVCGVTLGAGLLAAVGCTERRHGQAAAPAPDTTPPAAAARGTAAVSAADSTTAAAAADVVRRYYAAIEARDYRAAYVLWEGDGAASGKTLGAFAAGFANTAHVAARVGPPGAIGAAAGSRYVAVPVELRAATRDGAAQRFAGSYVLRRSEVDGATPAQRRWHLYSAKLHEDTAPHP